MARHAVRKGVTGLDSRLEVQDDLAQLGVEGLLLQDVEGADHRHPRVDHGGELTGEDGQVRELDLAAVRQDVVELVEELEVAPLLEGPSQHVLPLLGDGSDDHVAHLAELVTHLGGALAVHDLHEGFAAVVADLALVDGHGVSPLGS
ncbi:hypothetical protein D3C86_1384710 [compost metagenome]